MGTFSLRKGWIISVFFLFCHAERNFFLPLSVSITDNDVSKSESVWIKKSEAVICRVLINEITKRSTIYDLNSSIRSSAREWRPGRMACNTPSDGSSPTPSSADVQSAARSEYPNDSIAFIGSVGGRRVRFVNLK